MNAMTMLINTLFDLYLMVVLLRFWLQWAKADFYNPFSQFVVKATNPPLRPLRRVIPGWGGMDFASLTLAFLIAFLKITVLAAMQGAGFPWVPILISAFQTLIGEMFSLVIFILIIRAVLSWFSQGHNPIELVFHQLTEPMLAPIRRIIPPMGGFDLSVLVLIILLQVAKIFITHDLMPWLF